MANPKRYDDYWSPETFQEILRRSGITFNELARVTGINFQTLRSYASGRSEPGLSCAVKIADYFGLPVDVFVGHSTKEVYDKVVGDFKHNFMLLRRRSYETALAYRKEVLNHYEKMRGVPEAPYPYNLLDDVLAVGNQCKKERWNESLSQDQEAALRFVLSTFKERERSLLHLYYEDGYTLQECAIVAGLTRERIRQILAKCVRTIKHPSRLNLIKYGLDGYERQKALSIRLEELRKEETALLEKEQELERRKKVLEDDRTEEMLAERRSIVTLADMDLTVRSFNCLQRDGCNTLRDVCDRAGAGTLMRIPNLGQRSLEEILQKCIDYAGEDYRELYAG